MTTLIDRFIAIDPCLIHRSTSTYLDYLTNEARMFAMGNINQMYGPNWMNYKERACKEMKSDVKC